MTTRALRRLYLLALPLSVGAVVAATAQPVRARSKIGRHGISRHGSFSPTFALEDAPIGGIRAAAATPAFASSNAIATISDGTLQLGAIAIDEDSGSLVRTDRSGKLVASLPLRSGAAQLVYDPEAKLAYVTDRNADRVVVVEVSTTGLKQKATFATDVEPFGIALSPDRKTLLVTTIAEH